ncbi:efflux transporter outer membrane subunit [Dyella flagellata]|nr:efflux transporter outer membrane subunit [Dyella flagellata]
MTSPFTRTLLLSILASCIGGCMVGPDYQRPSVSMPANWSEAASNDDTTSAVPLEWWKLYGDVQLDALVQRALSTNLDLQHADYRIREARAMLRENRSALWPAVNASASAERGQQSANAPGVSPFIQGGDLGSGASLQNLFQAGFDASWELDLFGGTRRSIEAARANAQSAAFERNAVALSLTAEVARTYVDLRNSQAQLALSMQSAANQRDALSLVRSRYLGGLATDVEVDAAEAQLHSSEATLPAWETLSKQAIHRLGVLTGQPPEALIGELAASRPLNDTPPAIAVGLPSDLLRRRPDLQRAERQLAAATARIGVATAELYPRFSFDASGGLASFSASSFFDPHSIIWSIGPSLTWPVFRGGQIKATIEVRDIQAQQALLAYRQAILTALEDVENALAAYHDEQRHHDALAATVTSSRQVFERTRAQYQGGLIDFRGVLDQQQRLLQAEGDLERSTAAEWSKLFALYKALGGGWDKSAPHADTTVSSAPGHG